jgi:hypothetical protein
LSATAGPAATREQPNAGWLALGLALGRALRRERTVLLSVEEGVRDTSAVVGTGPIVLGGSAPGFRGFAQAFANQGLGVVC